MEQVAIFILGTIIGSFLNLVILRYNTGQSLIKGGSRCFNCGKNLKWHELIPVVSFVIQKGKCRQCKSKISWQYPLIEILTGIIFLLIFINFLNQSYWLLASVYTLAIFSILIVIAVYDLRHQIIPDGLVYAFSILAFLSLFRNWFVSWQIEIENFDLVGLLVGIIFFAFFASIWLLSRGKAMGLGDAKLALGIGWFLGWPNGIYALVLAFWLGALVGIFLVYFSKKSYNLKSSIPFGPFLILGALLAFFININIYF
ncbi:prepilin peptidase [Patescibacteria group bacterium]|nr:prepilin peptidase [Patescibacteria group bacterium]